MAKGSSKIGKGGGSNKTRNMNSDNFQVKGLLDVLNGPSGRFTRETYADMTNILLNATDIGDRFEYGAGDNSIVFTKTAKNSWTDNAGVSDSPMTTAEFARTMGWLTNSVSNNGEMKNTWKYRAK
ncbi:MAG: hypothetical protein IKX20_02950 [Paludibacteraceae bacterium]|nr:hypothetical protein [Paludibacteraceae bacterium]